METFELRYFLSVASVENIHRASEKIHISPASLSKAIARLEAELGVSLFRREGKSIKLTDHGKLLQLRASEIIRLEESTKIELSGTQGILNIVIAGPEVLFTLKGVGITQDLKNRFPSSRFEFLSTSEKEAISLVERGEAHLGLISSDQALHTDIKSKSVGEIEFQTFVSDKHLLAVKGKLNKTISVNEVLKYSFAGPSHPFLGHVGLKQSLDGWRDDKFPRNIQYLCSSLKMLEEVVKAGLAMAYLPEELGQKLGLKKIKMSDCSYSCKQKIKLIARNPKDISWLASLF